ncbi:MAG: DUF3383 domain-containing protein [Steroidobacteraceae bacterium]
MTIPASEFVSVIPGVVAASGNPLSLNAVFVDTDTSIPIGAVQSFGSLTAVQNWFGPTSTEATFAAVYFSGFSGGTQLPGTLYFTQYNPVAVSAYLRGGSVSALTLAQIQALSGTISIDIDGTAYTSAAINLASATSFSNAAALIQTGLQAGTPTTTATVTYDSLRQAFVITSSTTGTTSSIAYPTDTSLSPSLFLTQATGAVLSQGAAAATPASVMNNVVSVTQNWFSFMTVQQPAQSVMEEFATWVNGTNQRYCYVNWDSNVLYTESPPQPTVYAQVVANYNGCVTVYDAIGTIAAFVCGAVASINYSGSNQYVVLAAKGNPLLTPNVTSLQTYQNIIANGASCYAAVATANASFQWFQNGQISGAWSWIDEYAFQVYLNSQLQLAGANLLNTVKSIPYNHTGVSMQYSAYQSPISQGVTFGGIQTGITLDSAQILAVNTAAGVPIDSTLYQAGWYLKITIPSATVQGQRGPMPATLWYTNAGGLQSLSLNSLNVQ